MQEAAVDLLQLTLEAASLRGRRSGSFHVSVSEGRRAAELAKALGGQGRRSYRSLHVAAEASIEAERIFSAAELIDLSATGCAVRVPMEYADAVAQLPPGTSFQVTLRTTSARIILCGKLVRLLAREGEKTATAAVHFTSVPLQLRSHRRSAPPLPVDVVLGL